MRTLTWQHSYLGGYMTRAVRVLLITTLAVYLVQIVTDRLTDGIFSWLFALSVEGIKLGRVWQVVTYMFLHGDVAGTGLLHVLLNMLILFLIGPNALLSNVLGALASPGT